MPSKTFVALSTISSTDNFAKDIRYSGIRAEFKQTIYLCNGNVFNCRLGKVFTLGLGYLWINHAYVIITIRFHRRLIIFFFLFRYDKMTLFETYTLVSCAPFFIRNFPKFMSMSFLTFFQISLQKFLRRF